MQQWQVTNGLAPRLRLALLFVRQARLQESAGLELYLQSELAEAASGLSAESMRNLEFNRRLSSCFKTDPTKTRPSSEKLWRRIRRGDPFPRIMPLLDLINLLSLKWQILYGVYDLAKLSPPLQAALGRENDSYLSVGNAEISLQGRITLRDSHGPFGNPTCDSRRCAVGEHSSDFLIALYGWEELEEFPGYTEATEREVQRFFACQEITIWQEN
jgi:DNA/RNA-binding domain of Phe-tRNA-synthetase-like protein